MSAQIRTKLLALADRVIAAEDSAVTIATVLRLLAAQLEGSVELPAIDPRRDDLAHWRGLSDDQLRGENGADAWNLAAGLHVAHERAQAAAEKLAADVAQFSYRARAVQS